MPASHGAALLQRKQCATDDGKGGNPLSSVPLPLPWRRNLEECNMLKYAIIFAIISLVAGLFGFTGVAAGAAGIAKILFILFLILAVVFVILAVMGVGAARKIMNK